MKELKPFLFKSCFRVEEYVKCEENVETEEKDNEEKKEEKDDVRKKVMELGDLPRRLELLLLFPHTTWR